MNRVFPSHDVCSICLSEIVNPCITQCNHLFHEECFTKHTERSQMCPICRQSMSHYYCNGLQKTIRKPMVQDDLCYLDISEEYEEEKEEKEETDSYYEEDDKIPTIYMYLGLCLCVVFIVVSPFIITYRSGRCIYKSIVGR